jgi:hypothetical protein
MTTTTRQAIFISLLMIGGIAFLVGDLHKDILRAVWPILEAFWDYQAK